MLRDVLVTGRQIGPVTSLRLQRFFRVFLIGGSDRSLDIHPGAEICDHGVIVVNLGLRPISNDLACLLEIGIDLVYVHTLSAVLSSELGAVGGQVICTRLRSLVRERAADRIAFLDQGKVLAEGEPKTILSDPALAAIYFGERAE